MSTRCNRPDECNGCLREIIRDLTDERNDALAEVERLRHRRDKGLADLASLNAQAKTIGELMGKLESANFELRMLSEQAERGGDQLKEENAFLERDNAQLTSVISGLDTTIVELKRRMALDSQTSTVGQLTNDLQLAYADRDAYKSFYEQMKVQAAELRRMLDLMQATAERRGEAWSDQEVKVGNLEDENKRLQKLIRIREERLGYVDRENEELATALDASRRRYLALEMSITIAANGLKGLVN